MWKRDASSAQRLRICETYLHIQRFWVFRWGRRSRCTFKDFLKEVIELLLWKNPSENKVYLYLLKYVMSLYQWKTHHCSNLSTTKTAGFWVYIQCCDWWMDLQCDHTSHVFTVQKSQLKEWDNTKTTFKVCTTSSTMSSASKQTCTHTHTLLSWSSAANRIVSVGVWAFC